MGRIPGDVCANLIESMSRRIKAVYKAKVMSNIR